MLAQHLDAVLELETKRRLQELKVIEGELALDRVDLLGIVLLEALEDADKEFVKEVQDL